MSTEQKHQQQQPMSKTTLKFQCKADSLLSGALSDSFTEDVGKSSTTTTHVSETDNMSVDDEAEKKSSSSSSSSAKKRRVETTDVSESDEMETVDDPPTNTDSEVETVSKKKKKKPTKKKPTENGERHPIKRVYKAKAKPLRPKDTTDLDAVASYVHDIGVWSYSSKGAESTIKNATSDLDDEIRGTYRRYIEQQKAKRMLDPKHAEGGMRGIIWNYTLIIEELQKKLSGLTTTTTTTTTAVKPVEVVVAAVDLPAPLKPKAKPKKNKLPAPTPSPFSSFSSSSSSSSSSLSSPQSIGGYHESKSVSSSSSSPSASVVATKDTGCVDIDEAEDNKFLGSLVPDKEISDLFENASNTNTTYQGQPLVSRQERYSIAIPDEAI